MNIKQSLQKLGYTQAVKLLWSTTILLLLVSIVGQANITKPVLAATAGLYWANVGGNNLQFGRGDGTGAIINIHNTTAPTGIAIDETNGKIYWTDQAGDTVNSINQDGSGSPTTLFNNSDGVDGPGDVALDIANNKIYFTSSNNNTIYEGNIDGSGTPIAIFSGSGQGVATPQGLFLDTTNNRIYWVNSRTIAPLANTIYRGNTNGTGLTELFNTSDGVNFPYDVTVDVANNLIYWTNNLAPNIARGNADGSGSPTILYNTGSAFPLGLAINPSENQLVWTELDYGTINNIRSGAMDGSGSPTTLFDTADGVNFPAMIAAGFETPTAVTIKQVGVASPQTILWVLTGVFLLLSIMSSQLLLRKKQQPI